MPGLSRICHPFPAILYAEPPRNRRAEPSRSFRVGFGPRIFSFPAHTLISISPLTPASFFALLLFSLFTLMPAFALISDFPPILSRFLPALLLFSSFTLIPAFALISDFPPIPPRFFRLYSCFRPSSLHSYSFLFLIFPQSRPASSGFTPASVLYPYTAFALISDFSPNPAPLLLALLLLPSFTLIPHSLLFPIFPPIPPRFFRLYSCFRPSSLHSHSFLFLIFPQSRPASSGFTPASVLHPYTYICSY